MLTHDEKKDVQCKHKEETDCSAFCYLSDFLFPECLEGQRTEHSVVAEGYVFFHL